MFGSPEAVSKPAAFLSNTAAGGVFVMNENDLSWYIVRNTKGVTGFVGPGSKPVPLSEEEVKSMGIDLDKIGEKRTEIEVGEVVNVRDGVFKGQSGVVKELDLKNEKVKISVNNGTSGELSLELDLKSIETI